VEHLRPEQLERLRLAIVDELEVLRARWRRAAEPTEAEPIDVQERAALERDRARELAALRGDRKRMAELEAARGRMDAGSYGICEETGEEIPFERLLAEPTARLTVEAQESAEREVPTTSESEDDRDAY
jgi:DnaK suppressor protein